MTSKEELLSLLTGKVTSLWGADRCWEVNFFSQTRTQTNLETGEISDSLRSRSPYHSSWGFYNLKWGVKLPDTISFSSGEVSRLKTSIRLSQRLLLLAEIVSSKNFCTYSMSQVFVLVKPAVEEGVIATFRFDNYLQFLSEI